jgi:hypothetical protein
MRYIYHFAGIFSLFNFYKNVFFLRKRAYFASKLQNSAQEKNFFHLGALYRRKYWSYMKNALNKTCAEYYYLQLLFKYFFFKLIKERDIR